LVYYGRSGSPPRASLQIATRPSYETSAHSARRSCSDKHNRNRSTMTINRHPLQSIGVGQNSRMLPDEAVVPYCDSLGERLGWLADALGEEQKEGRLSIAAAKAAQAFLRE